MVDKAHHHLEIREKIVGRQILERMLIERLRKLHPGESDTYYEMNIYFDPPARMNQDGFSELMEVDGQDTYSPGHGDEGHDEVE